MADFLSNRKRILITAGPTWEPIDQVRYIGNRSSGRMGLNLTMEAIRLGHDVTLLLGRGATVERSEFPASNHFHTETFESTSDLEALLDQHFPDSDLLIMAAAVADFRVAHEHNKQGKIEREANDTLQLKLEKTPDIVAHVTSRKAEHQRVVAFALEEKENLEVRAEKKLRRKDVDAIVGNEIATIDSTDIEGIILFADDPEPVKLPMMSKLSFAGEFWQQMNRL